MFQRFILLLLTYNACFPLAELPAQQPDFKLLSPEKSGIDFINLLEEDSLRNVLNYQYLYNGGGVAAGDINNDGWCDLFFTGNAVPDQLYLNNGDGTFRNISTAAGINKNNGWSTGVAMADINNDGWLDIYVCRSGKFGTERRSNQLWMNNGNLTFTESAAAY
ncbi:MAG TPA: RNA-binding protein, partial [Bacteroidetes bacterium]|nr:RNA-binding protein [Bacteroidota bacterium]